MTIPFSGTVTFEASDPEIAWILGRPGFVNGPIAHRLRALGHDIKRHYEEEQASVFVWMLQLYMQHGPQWKEKAEEILKGPVPAQLPLSGSPQSLPP